MSWLRSLAAVYAGACANVLLPGTTVHAQEIPGPLPVSAGGARAAAPTDPPTSARLVPEQTPPTPRKHKAWVGMEEAPRLALDVHRSWMGRFKVSARHHFVPWVAYGLALSYFVGQRASDYHAHPREIALGAFLELHLVPKGLLDIWLRPTGGLGHGLGMPNGYYLYNERGSMGLKGFFEFSLGAGFGGPRFRIGPFAALGTNGYDAGLRLDVRLTDGGT